MRTDRVPHPASVSATWCPSAMVSVCTQPGTVIWRQVLPGPLLWDHSHLKGGQGWTALKCSNVRVIFISCSVWAASGLLGLLGPQEQRWTCCLQQPHLLPVCFLADKISVHRSRSMLWRPLWSMASPACHFQELHLSLLFQATLTLLARLETHLLPPFLAGHPCTLNSCPSFSLSLQ